MARVSPHEGACWSAARRPAWTSPLASSVTIWTARYRRDDDLAYGTRFRALSGIVVQPVTEEGLVVLLYEIGTSERCEGKATDVCEAMHEVDAHLRGLGWELPRMCCRL